MTENLKKQEPLAFKKYRQKQAKIAARIRFFQHPFFQIIHLLASIIMIFLGLIFLYVTIFFPPHYTTLPSSNSIPEQMTVKQVSANESIEQVPNTGGVDDEVNIPQVLVDHRILERE